MANFETVVGLEVHIQLSTNSKLFCGDSAAYGGNSNTHISPVTLAHPGSLPVLNKQAVEYAVKLGVALDCQITRHSYFDRKHYFYPDLPKGYQTSQSNAPICMGGYVMVQTAQGEKRIQLNHIHHNDDKYSSIDLNRAGVPLLELVTEPDIRSADEAYAFITYLRKLVRWINICDGNMEEGSLRCDANISIRPAGDTKLGTKVEIKNINSIRNVKRAIESEVARQINCLQTGEEIIQETRGYNADTNTTSGQREKENSNDYRYLPCPDLPPFEVSNEFLESIIAAQPMLPNQTEQLLVNQYGLSLQDAAVICEEKSSSNYFMQVLTHTGNAKAAANWLIGPVKSYLNENSITIDDFKLPPLKIAGLIDIVEKGTVSFGVASTKLLQALIQQPAAEVQTLAAQLGLAQENDNAQIEAWVTQVIAAMPDKVAEYKKGKKGLIGLFAGEVKKLSGGKANPQVTMQLLQKLLG
jgi:aspartyl-tRNA(Asn)/glutamyl-tRNA(Gln) amidotransferase subunit B